MKSRSPRCLGMKAFCGTADGGLGCGILPFRGLQNVGMVRVLREEKTMMTMTMAAAETLAR